jgi:hypothetical protein
MRRPRLRRPRPHWIPAPTFFLLVAYLALLACGLLALIIDPSPTVKRQGGNTFATVIGVVYMTAGLLGLYGRIRNSPLPELFGAGLGATASLVWTAALFIQAVRTHSATPLTAGCLGLTLTALLAYRVAAVKRRQN